MSAPNPVTVHGLLFAAAAYSAFFAALFVAAIVLPGRTVMGFVQPSGQRKAYKLNGPSLWALTHFLIIGGALVLDLSLTPLYREFWSLLVVANIFAMGWSVILWVRGRAKLGEQGRVGPIAFVKQLWIGVELNPTFLGVDLKVFAYHPSLIGLSILNVAFAWVQFEHTGTLTPQMIAYQLFWWAYMSTHYYYEAGMLSMWDIIAEKFGMMLVWGDLVLVTFFYCIGGWWVLEADPMPIPTVVGITAVFGLGLWIFRGANAQKDRFKRDRSTLIWGKPAETIGDRLLVSGWWGLGRKINYTGEIMVYLSFALCTGFASIVPYLLPLWLCVLLPHRAWRDEKRCREKYGELWLEYTRRARFRMIPFVY